MRLFCVGVSRLSLACAFVRPESEQNSSRLQTDVPLPCRLDLGTFPMQQLISWSRRRFAPLPLTGPIPEGGTFFCPQLRSTSFGDVFAAFQE
jgi:hypothetical protein